VTVDFSKQRTSWKIILKIVIGNVVICEVDGLMCVVLSEEEKHVPYGETVDTTECVTLQRKCRTNRQRHNRVQMYINHLLEH